MARSRLLAICLMLGVVLGLTPVSDAACAPPMITLDRSQAAPGDLIQVSGTGWVSGCDDTRGSSGGCSGPEESSPPMLGVELRLKGPKTDQTQAQLNVGAIGETDIDVLLETVDADEDGTFKQVIEVPHVAPGTYFLTGVAELPAYQPPQLIVLGGDG